jgi:hypothetical protein
VTVVKLWLHSRATRLAAAGRVDQVKTSSFIWTRSQSYDRELQRRRCKIYTDKSSLVHFENKNIFFYF